MDIIIRMIGVYIYQLQYFLIENDVTRNSDMIWICFLSLQKQKEIHLWYYFISLLF